MAKLMHEGKLKRGDLNQQLITQTYQEIGDGAAKGYGVGFKVIGDTGEPNQTVMAMRRNLFKFSCAKNVAELEALNDRLTKGGKIVPWQEFKEAAGPLSKRFLNYLQAEYQTAKQAGYHAANWAAYERDKHLYPNLKYKITDKNTRDSHRALNGIVAPIGGAFWSMYYPPNGWRCACYTVQTAENASLHIPDDVPDVKPEFRINTGISGQVFKEDGPKPAPYFALAKGPEMKRAFEQAKIFAPYELAYKAKNKAKVEVSIFADEQDLVLNLSCAKLIANELSESIKIRPNVNTNILKGWKNPEYAFGNNIGERKAIKTFANLNKTFQEAKAQCMNKFINPNEEPFVVVLDLVDMKGNPDFKFLERELSRNVHGSRGTKIHSVIVVYNGKAVKLLREDILKRKFTDMYKIQ